MRINKAVFRYIEHELFSYETTKSEIEHLRDDVLYSSSIHDGQPKAVGVTSDSTGSKALKLTTSTALMRMERTVRAIESALARLNDTHMGMFALKYKHKLDMVAICNELPISERSYFRVRNEIVIFVGVELGLIHEAQAI